MVSPRRGHNLNGVNDIKVVVYDNGDLQAAA
jgi:hypothetical protein